MGRPRANLAYYSIWGSYPIVLPTLPNPLWLPVVPLQGVATFSDLVIYALSLPIVDARVSLFTNFFQPQENSVIANFTAPTAAGLAAQALPAAVSAGQNNCGRSNWSFPGLVFTAAGAGLPVQIWGYYVYCTDPITGVSALLWAQRLQNSFAFTAGGQTLPVPLSLSLAQC